MAERGRCNTTNPSVIRFVEETAAAAGRVGQVRPDPMAMLPFCGCNMGDYFRHWIDMRKKIRHLPRLFFVN